jgi:AcrR family transcriptional regulator
MEDTRSRLICAAERLFAEHGVDGVSLREIVRTSGARNATALHYHFGDRAGLIRAVVDKHGPDVEVRRHALLDACEAELEAEPGGSAEAARPAEAADRAGQVRLLAGALVRPLAAKLEDGDGGPEYLQILSELMNRPRPKIDPAALEDPANSMYRWRALVSPLLDEESTRLHRRFIAFRFTLHELARRARSGPHTDNRLFASDLIDLVAAMLLAPPSTETLRLAAERDAARV